MVKVMPQAEMFTEHVSDHVNSSLQAIHAGLTERSKACYAAISADGDWKRPMLKTPSSETLKAPLAAKGADGSDLIDRTAKVLADWQALWDARKLLESKGVRAPAMDEKTLTEVKFFLCACSAWDLMLGEMPASKQQRSADVGALNQTVNAACPDVFPASLMQLLSLWEEGKSVASVL